jgi:ribonuclease P protein component
VIGRITRSAEFDEVLKTRPLARSSHFTLHHLAKPSGAELSTSPVPTETPAVDSSAARPAGQPHAVRLGIVVPKRHARRAVTRSLLKRQVRCAVARHADRLAGGCWVVRMTAAFDAARGSAASTVLRCAARTELDALLERAASPPPPQ